MKLKLLMFAVLLILFSVPALLFFSLSYFSCGFVNDRLCCSVDGTICCISATYSGCIQSYDSNMVERCKNYCFELQSRIGAGMDVLTLPSLSYCQNNCSAYYPCVVLLQNGTIVQSIC